MSFDLKKYLAEGGIEARLNEDHSGNPNDKYVVKKCTKKEGEPWAVWEGKTRVKGFASKAEAEKYAKKQNKKQNLKEGEKPFNEKTPDEMNTDGEFYDDDNKDSALAQAGIPESKKGETQGMSDNDFIMALNKAFSAADAMLEEGEEELEEDLYEGEEPLDEEEVDEGRGRPSGTGREREVNFKIFTGDRSEENILKLLKKFNKLYTSPKNPTLNPKAKKRRTPFSDEDLQNLAELFASGEPVTSKKIMAAIPRYKTTAPANDFLKVMDEMGRSKITSVDKKVQDLTAKEKRASGETPETRGRKKKAADDDNTGSSPDEPSDEDISDIEKEFGLEENDEFLDEFLSTPLGESKQMIDKLEDQFNDQINDDDALDIEDFLDKKGIKNMKVRSALIQKYKD